MTKCTLLRVLRALSILLGSQRLKRSAHLDDSSERGSRSKNTFMRHVLRLGIFSFAHPYSCIFIPWESGRIPFTERHCGVLTKLVTRPRGCSLRVSSSMWSGRVVKWMKDGGFLLILTPVWFLTPGMWVPAMFLTPAWIYAQGPSLAGTVVITCVLDLTFSLKVSHHHIFALVAMDLGCSDASFRQIQPQALFGT